MIQSPSMDAKALERGRAARFRRSSTLDELEEARVALPRPQERARAGAARRPRPRDRDAPERHPRAARGGGRRARARRSRDAELDRRLREEVVDVTLPGEELPLGHLHPITQIRRAVEDAFLGLGYEVRDDREVETVEYNFDKLAFPPTHPARSPRDTFFFDETHVLRTETSPVADPHPSRRRQPPIYMVSIGRVYRRDAITATRYPIFHQFEGLAVDRG